MRCDLCQGSGWLTRWRMISDTLVGRRRVLRREPCPRCMGTCAVSCCAGAEPEDAVEAVRAPEEAGR